MTHPHDASEEQFQEEERAYLEWRKSNPMSLGVTTFRAGYRAAMSKAQEWPSARVVAMAIFQRMQHDTGDPTAEWEHLEEWQRDEYEAGARGALDLFKARMQRGGG
jgi:hypothetical protein